MKLEMEFAIQILEAMESSDRAIIEKGQRILEGMGVGEEKYGYHCLMLEQAGLIRLWPTNNFQELIESGSAYVDPDNAIVEDLDFHDNHSILAHPMMITYEGHKFLEVVRTEGSRNRLRTFLAENGMPWALTTVKEVGFKFLTA